MNITLLKEERFSNTHDKLEVLNLSSEIISKPIFVHGVVKRRAALLEAVLHTSKHLEKHIFV